MTRDGLDYSRREEENSGVSLRRRSLLASQLFPNVSAVVIAAGRDIDPPSITATIKSIASRLPVICLYGQIGAQCPAADYSLSSHEPEKLLELLRSLLGDSASSMPMPDNPSHPDPRRPSTNPSRARTGLITTIRAPHHILRYCNRLNSRRDMRVVVSLVFAGIECSRNVPLRLPLSNGLLSTRIICRITLWLTFLAKSAVEISR